MHKRNGERTIPLSITGEREKGFEINAPFSSGSEEFYCQCKNEHSYTTHYVDSTAFNKDTLFFKNWLIENSAKGKQCNGT